MFKGKKYKNNAKLVNRTTLYDPKDAFELLCNFAKSKFDETVELHIRLGVDSRQADQQVRGALVLPHGTGKNMRVLVLCKPENEQEAKDAGADFVGLDDMIQRIQDENWFDYDVIIATPDVMNTVSRLGRVLGPKGLMPTPRAGTVSANVGQAVQEVKAGKIEYRLDRTNIVHCPIGKASFGPEKLFENYSALIDALIRAKPAASKGQYIRSCVTASTMSPGIRINANKPN